MDTEKQKITHQELLDVLTDKAALGDSALSKEQAEQFLEMLLASLEREIADRATNPNELPVDDWREMPIRVGLVPIDSLVDAVAVGTGLPRIQVRECIEKLNLALKNKLLEFKLDVYSHVPVEVEGLGIFKYTKKNEMVLRPFAFEYLASNE